MFYDFIDFNILSYLRVLVNWKLQILLMHFSPPRNVKYEYNNKCIRIFALKWFFKKEIEIMIKHFICFIDQCIVVKSLVLHIFLYLVIVQSWIFEEQIIKEGNWQDNSKIQEETWQDHSKNSWRKLIYIHSEIEDK